MTGRAKYNTPTGFDSLARPAAAIMGLGALIWCLAANMAMLDSLFRALVVWLTGTVILLVLQSALIKLNGSLENNDKNGNNSSKLGAG